MPERAVAPIVDPIIDTVWDFETKATDFAESISTDIADRLPLADRISAGVLELTRKAFDFQRDLSKRIVEAVDDTIGTVGETVADVVDTGAEPADGQ